MTTRKNDRRAAPSASPYDEPDTAYMVNAWSRNLVQPVLIALLITALFAALLIVIEVIFAGRGWLPLALIFFLASLQGTYTSLWLEHPDRRSLNATAFRAAEFVVLIMIVRLFTWLISGSWPALSQLPHYLRFPLLLLGDGRFLVGVVLTFLAWQRALAIGETFATLALDRAEVHYVRLPPGERSTADQPVRANRHLLVAEFFQQWVAGGFLLAICTALTSFDLPAASRAGSLLNLERLGLRPELLLILIVYFMAGFALLSQARLAALNARWLYDGAQKSMQVERRWHRSSLWLLLIIGLAASFLPLGSTLGIARILNAALLGLTAVLSLLSFLFLNLMGLFFAPLLANPPAEGAAATLVPAPTPLPTPLPPPTGPPDDTAALIFSSFFWAVVIVMTIIAVSYFLRERGFRLDAGLLKAWWQGLTAWLHAFWGQLAGQARSLQKAVRERLPTRATAAPKQPKAGWRFIRLNALSPREQIRYFYLSTIRRAGQQGVRRGESETPLEYAEDLKQNWPDAEADVDELTGAFLEARYSRKSFDREAVNPIKRRWKQIRARLRRRQS